MEKTFEIKEYTESASSPFSEWFNSLDAVSAARIDKYIRRLETGNFGSAKALREGVFELKNGFWAGLSSVLWKKREDDYYFIRRWQQTATIRRHRRSD